MATRLRLAAGLVPLLLVACASSGGAVAAPSSSPGGASPQAATAAATPTPTPSALAVSCTGKPTPALTEGPYFKAGSPERSSLLEPGLAGTHLALSGHVLSLSCRPLAGAVLDFWQADASGVYDNSGHRLRGHELTAADGGYSLETVMPGKYSGRTLHIHAKVNAPGAALTTQLYFPGVASNGQDSIFDPALLVTLADAAGGKTATFDFVLNLP